MIIEDNCFIWRAVGGGRGRDRARGLGVSMGVYLGASTKIIDRTTGETHLGEVPPYSVVVAGSAPGRALPGENWGPSLYCAVIVKRVDERTRAKTSINELLRD